MNRFLSILFLVIVAFLTWYPSWAMAKAKKGPHLVIEESLYDFKEVKEGTVLKHDFKMLNKGDETLIIEKVRPG
jgi:hypothetical protein